MRNLDELNVNEGGRPVARLPATDEQLQQFETKHGLVLPAGLRQLLRHSNGGHPELDTIRAVGSGDSFSVSRFHHLDGDGTGSLAYAIRHWSPILGHNLLPFAGDGGGNQFVVDLRDGAVAICLHDQGFKVVPLSPSFEAFLAQLAIDEEML